MTKLDEIFITTDHWDKIPVKIFLTNIKMWYIQLTKMYDALLQKMSIGKFRQKTYEKLIIEMKELQQEMIEVWATFRSAFEYASNQWGKDELLEDKFLADWRQLTDEQKAELDKEQEDAIKREEETRNKLDLYKQYLEKSAVKPPVKTISDSE